MQETCEIDLQDIESRLYGQVFHSTENWEAQESATTTQNTAVLNESSNRQVSRHKVNNIPTLNTDRYWAKPNHYEPQYLPLETATTCTPIPPPPEQIEPKLPLDSSCNQNPVNQSETHVQSEVLNKRAAKRKRQKLRRKEKGRLYKLNLNNLAEENRNNNHTISWSADVAKLLNYNVATSQVLQVPCSSAPSNTTSHPNQPINELEIHKDKTSAAPGYEEQDVIVLSDSDGDSVIEVPPSPKVIYSVDSSDESDTAEIPTNDKVKEVTNEVDLISLKNNDTEMVETLPSLPGESMQLVPDELTTLSKGESAPNEPNCENLEQPEADSNKEPDKKVENFSQPENMSEKERTELLRTPDSTTNDFIENDVNSLNKKGLSFNFVLHGSDLDLSNKDFSKCNSLPATDLYETESSCSEAGTINKTPTVFNEINFESPTREIFCEPDLVRFSNFITPVRNTSTSNTVKSNLDFTPVKTKASSAGQSSKTYEYNSENAQSDSEYNSDSMAIHVKKKAKKKKKKKKGKKKTEEEPGCDDQKDNKAPEEIPHIEAEQQSQENVIIEVEKQKEEITPMNVVEQEQENKTTSDNYKFEDYFFADDAFIVSLEAENEKKQSLDSKPDAKESQKADFSFVDTWQKAKQESGTEPNNQEIHVDKEQRDTSLNDTQVNKNDQEQCSTSKQDTDNCQYIELEEKIENDTTIIKKPLINKETTIEEIVISSENDSDVTHTEATPKKRSILLKEYKRKMSKKSSSHEPVQANFVINTTPTNFGEHSNPTAPLKNLVANPCNISKREGNWTFRDYWTHDMKKFYDDSWGHENYDCNTAISAMPSDMSRWKILPEDKFKSRSPRKKGPMCFRCKEFGHSKFSCTRFPGPDKCAICGAAGHVYTRCPNQICTTCGNRGSYHTTSCHKCSHFKSIRCNLCKMIGHDHRNCPDLWRRYHLTTEEHDQLTVPSQQSLKPVNQRWCSNCAQKGHLQNVCTAFRYDHYPTNPQIINYTPTYNRLLHLPPPTADVNVPMFTNTKLADIVNHKEKIISANNKKYANLLKSLRRQCARADLPSYFKNISRLERCLASNRFSNKNLGELFRLRSAIERSNVWGHQQ